VLHHRPNRIDASGEEQEQGPGAGLDRKAGRRRRRRPLRLRLLYIAVLCVVALLMMWLAPHPPILAPNSSALVKPGGGVPTSPEPGGLGGVTLTQQLGAAGLMYGGNGTNGACLGTSGSIPKMLTFDFGWNGAALAHFINTKWRGDTADQLCNDHYTWDIAVTMPVQNAIQQLMWPADLLDPNYVSRPVALRPIQSFDTRTLQAQAQQKGVNQPADPNGSCISLSGIDWGACWSGFWGAISQGIASVFHGFIDWATSFIPMFTTSPALTYNQGVVKNLWAWSLGVADAALALFLVIGGYNALLRHTLGANYHGVLEFLPRLILAAIAANFSLNFIASFIELNNALCLGVQGALATAGAGDLSLPWGILNIVTLPFYAASVYLIEGFISLLLVVQAVLRIALLDFLTILAPIWLLMLGLKQTERFGKLGATAFGATCFLQFLQSLAIGSGSALIAGFGHSSLTPITMLVGLGTVYLAFKIPGMLYGAVLRPIENGSSSAGDMGARLAMLLAA
jgi:hypothetical protein